MECPGCGRDAEELHPPVAATEPCCADCLREQENMLDRVRLGGQSSLDLF